MPVIPAFRSLGQEDHELKASLGYTERPCIYIKKKKKSMVEELRGGQIDVYHKTLLPFNFFMIKYYKKESQ
jgi:hypothetical protein